MAITTTTLAAAMGQADTFAIVASATGITAPNNQTGTGMTWLRINQEVMPVITVSGVVIGVLRGQNGTTATTHVSGEVQIGLPADFGLFNELLGSLSVEQHHYRGLQATRNFLSGTADVIPAGVAAYYVIKTGSADAMTLLRRRRRRKGTLSTYGQTLSRAYLDGNGIARKRHRTQDDCHMACISWSGNHAPRMQPRVSRFE